MEIQDAKNIVEMYRKWVKDWLVEISKHMKEMNPSYDPKVFDEILDNEEWALQKAWEELYGRDE